ncbi:hypothetical protein [Aeribacillus composti]|uniref:hypothetical protein n=1 Tax=Aeribacillus composti TaxID=1868734 RepID=UPI002E1BC902|nr:hypothetical protein [Aeribacillus composti]
MNVNLGFDYGYQILSDRNGVMTVAFLMKMIDKAEWEIVDIYAGKSYDMLLRLERLGWDKIC